MLVPPLLDALIDRSLEEDLAGGDLTTEACVDAGAEATGQAVARRALVVCGGAVFRRVFERLDPAARFEAFEAEGTSVPTGAVIWRVRARARALLSGERTALNLAQRMSGVATAARRYVEALPAGSSARITDTLKKVEAAGFDEVILYFNVGLKPHSQVKDEMARFAAEVAPAFGGARKDAA